MEWQRTVPFIKIQVLNINFCSLSLIILFSFFDNLYLKLWIYTKGFFQIVQFSQLYKKCLLLIKFRVFFKFLFNITILFLLLPIFAPPPDVVYGL